jgi:hypothetical protein
MTWHVKLGQPGSRHRNQYIHGVFAAAARGEDEWTPCFGQIEKFSPSQAFPIDVDIHDG